MAKGQDTRNHPNRQVSRKTPRIADALGEYLNHKVETAYDDLSDENPALGYTMAGTPQYLNYGDSQRIIDRYREDRDSGQWNVKGTAENIRDAIRWHRDQNGLGW